MKKLYPILVLVILLTSCGRQTSLTKSSDKGNSMVSDYVVKDFQAHANNTTSTAKYSYTVAPQDYYEDAYTELKLMLTGESPLSFKKSVFLTENAWFENKLNYNSYDSYIKAMALVAKSWKKANPLLNYKWNFDSDKVALNGAVYHVFSDTIKDKNNRIVSIPYQYDFNDCFAKEHWENMFVTKLMATHGGNCHSLPFLYKMVAEELGTDANLCFLPGHIYLNQYSRKTSYYNTELTGKCFPVDAWLMSSGYVSMQSIRSGLYMDTLGIQQSIAVCVNDLAKGYQRKFGRDTGAINDNEARFILKCCDLGLKYYPNYGELLLLKAETLKKLYQKQSGEQAQYTYAKMEQTYANLAKLDYREIPDALYDRWTNAMINGGKPENENIHDTIVTTNVYGSFGKKTDMIAVSNGSFVELFENDTLRRIGSIMFNNITHKVAYFISSEDEKYKKQLDRPTVASRFMSIDPVASHFPHMSPYSFANNSPISMLDNGGDSTIFYTEGGQYLGMTNDRLPNAVVVVPDENLIAFKVLNQTFLGGSNPATLNMAAAILRKQGSIYEIDPIKQFWELHKNDFMVINGKQTIWQREHGTFLYEHNGYVTPDLSTNLTGDDQFTYGLDPYVGIGNLHIHPNEGGTDVLLNDQTGQHAPGEYLYNTSDPDDNNIDKGQHINIIASQNHIYFNGPKLHLIINAHKFGRERTDGTARPPQKIDETDHGTHEDPRNAGVPIPNQ